MSDLLRELEEKNNVSIPLLQAEDEEPARALFTEEELAASRRRKRFSLGIKLAIPVIFVGMFLLASWKAYACLSRSLESNNFKYQLHSLSIHQASESGIQVTINATYEPETPWSFDLKSTEIHLFDDKFKSIAASVSVPYLKVISGKENPLNLQKTTVQIRNASLLALMINAAVRERKANIPVEVTSNVHAHWIPWTFNNLKMRKELTVDFSRNSPIGFKKYISIRDPALKETADDAIIIAAIVDVMNPTALSVEQVPVMSFKLFSENRIFLGRLKTLKPFDVLSKKQASIAVQIMLDPNGSDGRAMDEISKIVSNFVSGTSSRIYLRGDEASFSGNLKWLNEVLASIFVPIDIPGNTLEEMFDSAIQRIDVKRLWFRLNDRKPDRIELNSGVKVHDKVPKMLSMMRPKIEKLAMNGKVNDLQGNYIASLSISEQQVQEDLESAGFLKTSVVMDVDRLLIELLGSNEATVAVGGHSSLKTKVPFERIPFSGIPIAAKIKLPGLGGMFASQTFQISKLELLSTFENELIFSTAAVIENPTKVASNLGTIHFRCSDLRGEDIIGELWLLDVYMRPGANLLQGRIHFLRGATAEKFLTRLYWHNEGQEMLLQGVEGSDKVHPVLTNASRSVSLQATLQPQASTSFVSAVHLRRSSMLQVIPDILLTVNNPLPITVKVMAMRNIKVFAYESEESEKEVLIAQMEKISLAAPIVIPAGAENYTDEEHPVPLQFDGNLLRAFTALKMILNRENPRDKDGTFDVELFLSKDRLALYYDQLF